MSFLDLTSLISDEQLSELAALNAERAAEGKELITLLDVMADDTILESTGVDLTSEGSEAVLNEMAAINAAAAGLAEEDRFTGQDTNEIIQGLVQENIDSGETFIPVSDVIETYIDDQANATVELAGGELDLSDLPDYGLGSAVLAPDGKGIIRGGTYIPLDPTQSSMSASEINELKSNATRNTNLLLAQQEFEDNGTPIAETLGLKMPGDDNFDRDDRERIQEAENAAAILLREQSDLDYHKYLEKKSDDGPSAIEIHNQIFGGGGNAPGTVKQDENGNWYAVTGVEGSNVTGRDYSIDPKDNSQGPTFGGNVSKNVEETFAEEVAAAGGSSDFEGSILDTFKDTDVDSLGYDAATGTYNPVETVVETETDIAQPGDLDLDDDISIDPVSEAAQKYIDDDLSGLDLLAEETGTEPGFTPTGYTFEAVEDFDRDDQLEKITDVYDYDDYAKMLQDDDDTPYNELTPEGKAAIDAGIVDLATSALDQVEEDDGPGFFRPGQGGFDVKGFDTGTGLLLEGSGALTTKMLGNFISAMEDLGGLPSLGFTGVQEFGEDLRAQGEATKLEVLGKLQTDAPDTFDALNRPIMGDDGFDFEALAAKGYYSSIPTILGLSGIPFGVTAALVTGGIMTGAEVGTEARDDTYNTAIEMGYSVAEAETLSRSASTMATALGMPIGGLSNILFSTVLPGSGAGSIATVAGNIVEEAVTEGYIEQNAAALAVDEMLGTDRFGKAYSIDEGIVGGLVGGAITIATINNAINNAVDSSASPGGEASPGGPSATDLATASEILNSGADVSIVTDSNGDLIITDTGTGQSVNVGSVISSSVPISGSETTAADLTAAEDSVVSGASDVTINSTGA